MRANPRIVPRRRASVGARRLALGAIAGPLVYDVAWIVLGFTRDGYSPTAQFVSDLGTGPNAAVLNAASVLYGLLLIAGVAGVFLGLRDELEKRALWTSAVLLSLPGVGGILEGLFPDEESPAHGLAFLLAFVVTPVFGFVVAGRRLASVPRYRRFGRALARVGAPVTVALVVLLLVSISAAGDLDGLMARVVVLALHGWYATLGRCAFRSA
ncbi:DUF998 domain-containing protein [Spirillospora sp. CA-294931]|uniref:DUF998 domain-containing protein n=1 Tax=Spirillospora sp. CA-294931 TaxID=3240042 RepID=UPI003D8FFFC9